MLQFVLDIEPAPFLCLDTDLDASGTCISFHLGPALLWQTRPSSPCGGGRTPSLTAARAGWAAGPFFFLVLPPGGGCQPSPNQDCVGGPLGRKGGAGPLGCPFKRVGVGCPATSTTSTPEGGRGGLKTQPITGRVRLDLTHRDQVQPVWHKKETVFDPPKNPPSNLAPAILPSICFSGTKLADWSASRVSVRSLFESPCGISWKNWKSNGAEGAFCLDFRFRPSGSGRFFLSANFLPNPRAGDP